MSALGGTAKPSAKRPEEVAFYWILPHVPDTFTVQLRLVIGRFGGPLS